MLTLRLFGSGFAAFGDQPLMGFPGQLPCLLLCYLLLNRNRRHHREQLAAVFWGEHDTNSSRKRLRDAIWRLRHMLQSAGASPDSFLSVDEDNVSFVHSSPYWLDIEVFETTVNRYRDLAGENLTSDQALDLEAAAQLYQGDLLEGIYDDWCLSDREHLHLFHLSALTKLMHYCGATESYEQGLTYGQQILAIDNAQESVHRQMMLLYWLAGNRCAAVCQFKRCMQILREELGVSPVEETLQLYQRILHEQVEPLHRSEATFRLTPSNMISNEAQATASDYALQRLHHLGRVLEQSTRELQEIECVLGQVLQATDKSTWTRR